MTGRAELPLRIDDAPGGAVIRCLCGAEAAVMAPTITDQWRGPSECRLCLDHRDELVAYAAEGPLVCPDCGCPVVLIRVEPIR